VAGELFLGHQGQEIKLPAIGREVTPDYDRKARGEPMASGRYVEDIMWTKNIWKIDYEVMKGEFLEQMVELYESGEFLNFIEIDRLDNQHEYEVKMILKPPARWKIVGPWYWRGGQIELRQVDPNASD